MRQFSDYNIPANTAILILIFHSVMNSLALVLKLVYTYFGQVNTFHIHGIILTVLF